MHGAESRRMLPGQAFVGPQNRNMQAFNVADGSSNVLVVTMGAEGQPVTLEAQLGRLSSAHEEERSGTMRVLRL